MAPLRRAWLLGLCVAFTTILVYVGVIPHDFVNWDDNIHIYENPYFLPVTAAHLTHFWRWPYQGLYIPLAYALFAGLASISRHPTPDPALTSALLPFDPHVFHAASLLFHVGNTLLVYILLRRIVRSDVPAAAGALLFALHPLQVESVAWASELRGLSSAFFSLICLLLALPRQERTKPVWIPQLSAILTGVLALLCKPSAVVLPLAIVVVDRWLLGRSGKMSLTIAGPLLLLDGGSIWITQHAQAVPAQYLTPVWTRPFIAGDALCFYLVKFFAPVSLAIDYGRTPRWLLSQPWGYATWLVPVAVAALALLVRRRFPWLTGCLLLSLVCLAPELGLTPFLFQKYSTVADRYAYLALLGPALILAYMLRGLEETGRYRLLALGLAVMIVSVLGALSFQQMGIWRDTTALMTNAIKVNGRSALAFSGLAGVFEHEGRIESAAAAYQAALQADPSIAVNHFNLGNDFDQLGREDEAIAEYRTAIQLEPDVARVHNNLGIALQRAGKNAEAITEFQEAVMLDPTLFAAHANLATLLMGAGRVAEAVTEYRAALSLDPNSAVLHALLGDALAAQRDAGDAMQEYQASLRLDPSCAPAQAGLRRLQAPAK